MGKNRDKLAINEFKILLKAGAIWVVMNVENDYPPADGLWFHLKQMRTENCKTKQSIDKVWGALKSTYLERNVGGLYEIISGDFDFETVRITREDEHKSRLTF